MKTPLGKKSDMVFKSKLFFSSKKSGTSSPNSKHSPRSVGSSSPIGSDKKKPRSNSKEETRSPNPNKDKEVHSSSPGKSKLSSSGSEAKKPVAETPIMASSLGLNRIKTRSGPLPLESFFKFGSDNEIPVLPCSKLDTSSGSGNKEAGISKLEADHISPDIGPLRSSCPALPASENGMASHA